MIVEFDKSFDKSLDKIAVLSVRKKIILIIETLEKANSIREISNIKKLIGFKNYYRIRIGDYRIGFELINVKTIRLIIVASRKDIYKLFP